MNTPAPLTTPDPPTPGEACSTHQLPKSPEGSSPSGPHRSNLLSFSLLTFSPSPPSSPPSETTCTKCSSWTLLLEDLKLTH